MGRKFIFHPVFFGGDAHNQMFKTTPDSSDIANTCTFRLFFQSEIGEITRTLENWFEGCDEMLACLQNQAMRANGIKASHFEHKNNIEKKVNLKYKM